VSATGCRCRIPVLEQYQSCRPHNRGGGAHVPFCVPWRQVQFDSMIQHAKDLRLILWNIEASGQRCAVRISLIESELMPEKTSDY
jgi:hypothetical protein